MNNRLGPLLGITLLAVAISGCQTQQQVADTPKQEKTSGIHLQLHQEPILAGHDTVTLVSANETLQKAIRAAYPDAPISADSGVHLDQRVNVWADGLSPSRFLSYLGSQVDAHIRYTSRGEVEVRSSSQWEFTLPRDEASDLMPQAVSLARQANIKPLVLGDAKHILVLSGKPSDLDQVRRALNLVSDRISLERNLQADGDEA